jgi:arginase family enzyme
VLEPLDDLRERFGITLPHVTAAQVEYDSSVVLAWLRSTSASHVAVHFDLDVLEPRDFHSTTGHDSNGLRVAGGRTRPPANQRTKQLKGRGI